MRVFARCSELSPVVVASAMAAGGRTSPPFPLVVLDLFFFFFFYCDKREKVSVLLVVVLAIHPPSSFLLSPSILFDEYSYVFVSPRYPFFLCPFFASSRDSHADDSRPMIDATLPRHARGSALTSCTKCLMPGRQAVALEISRRRNRESTRLWGCSPAQPARRTDRPG
ncbi:uncharacterized protein K489DRAFT_98245 [Dissoconium aciculare CBS 342.82]|uniref:Uncharacterized protein n=1 Tax=Dissoconium aciculare CBS 342.82 TaxID=1314786 RepID=A0A6J3MD28_9PEZI|nr:uncharacterized protein K489DRAFT_98245 [Dissoconium aciculare CBS 342.82]KAF1825783.1 hypothetical protein K489DRAFT_98245 [Dissoconium aciculare CBS 342.82]